MKSRTALRLATALAIGLAEPYVEIAWKCRAGHTASEACVWGKAYLSAGRYLVPILVTPIAYGILLVIEWAWRQWRPRAE